MEANRKQHYSETYNRHSETKDVSGTYKTAKIQAGWKATATLITFNIQGRKVTAPQEIADIQLDTFRKKTEKLLNQLPPITQDPLSSLEGAMGKWAGKADRPSLKFKTL